MKLPRRPWILIAASVICLSVGIPAHAWSSGGEHGDADLAHGAAAGTTQMVSDSRAAAIVHADGGHQPGGDAGGNAAAAGAQCFAARVSKWGQRRSIWFCCGATCSLRAICGSLPDAQNTIHVDNCDRSSEAGGDSRVPVRSGMRGKERLPGDGQRGTGVSDHRFGISADRAGRCTGETHSLQRMRFRRRRFRCCSGRRTGRRRATGGTRGDHSGRCDAARPGYWTGCTGRCQRRMRRHG